MPPRLRAFDDAPPPLAAFFFAATLFDDFLSRHVTLLLFRRRFCRAFSLPSATFFTPTRMLQRYPACTRVAHGSRDSRQRDAAV